MNGLNNGLYDGLNNGLQNGLFDGTLNGLHNGLNSSDIGYDIDAYKFIVSANIALPLERYAIDYLVKRLKITNIWNKMTAIYPFVGGTAFSHKWNLKDPRDLNAAFRLSFVNSPGKLTHTFNGVLPSYAHADTFITQNSTSQNSVSISYYSRTNSYENTIDMGVGNDATSFLILEINRNAAGGIVSAIVNSNTRTGAVGVGNRGSTGFYIASRTASNSQKLYKNGSAIQTSTAASTSLLNKNIVLFAYNGPSAIVNWSLKECSFASVGSGLNDIEANYFNQIVQTYQTILGRQLN